MARFDWVGASVAPRPREFKPSKWLRVTRRHPCPVCGKPDWCTYTAEGDAVACMRVWSDHEMENGGYLHKDFDQSTIADYPQEAPEPPKLDVSDWLTRFVDFSPEGLAKASCEMALSLQALESLDCGWCRVYNAFAFPMSDAEGWPIGVRLRHRHGQWKRAVLGSRAGLFIPKTFSRRGTLYVCEGPTDTAAMLGLGFNAIGRPSCSGQVQQVSQLVQGMVSSPDVVIVADNDAPDERGIRVGMRGAQRLGEQLRIYARTVRIITPPAGIKDVRDWVANGARKLDIERVALSVCCVKGGG